MPNRLTISPPEEMKPKMSTDCTWRQSTTARSEKILPLRSQARVRDAWLAQRFETVLPELMRREGLDMWLVIAREYNEDPVILSLLPAAALSARRLSMLVFTLREDGQLEKLTVSRYPVPPFYNAAWNPEREGQWEALARVIHERAPQAIGINISETFAFGDGLTHSQFENLVNAIGPTYTARLRSAERLCVGWLERRIAPEMDAYPGIVAIAHGLIDEFFSSRVCHPGVTTAEDLVWWFRQQVSGLGLTAWFHPSVDIQRAGCERVAPSEVILPGDMLHCDVGLHYLGLGTDTQELAYVLKRGEVAPPAGLLAAMANGNRFQDITVAEFAAGRSGNEILLGALAKAAAEGLKASLYTHPLGYHGHGAGPTIGLWDAQEGVPGRGDYPLFADTVHSLELNVKTAVPEWGGQEVTAALEQDILFSDGKVIYLGGRQTKYHLIG